MRVYVNIEPSGIDEIDATFNKVFGGMKDYAIANLKPLEKEIKSEGGTIILKVYQGQAGVELNGFGAALTAKIEKILSEKFFNEYFRSEGFDV